MDNYRTIEQKLRTLTPFKGNSMHASIDVEGSYRVFSYSTLIAIHYGQGLSWTQDKKYSTTTSRHQNLIRKAWGI